MVIEYNSFLRAELSTLVTILNNVSRCILGNGTTRAALRLLLQPRSKLQLPPGISPKTPDGRMTKAFQKPVLSSSFRSAAEHAYKAVDGNLETQWATDDSDAWLWVDLLGLYAVHHVVLVLGDVVPSHFVPGLFWLLGHGGQVAGDGATLRLCGIQFCCGGMTLV